MRGGSDNKSQVPAGPSVNKGLEATGYAEPGRSKGRQKNHSWEFPYHLSTSAFSFFGGRKQDPEKWQIHNHRADFGKAKTKTKVPVPYYFTPLKKTSQVQELKGRLVRNKLTLKEQRERRMDEERAGNSCLDGI